MGLFGLLQIQPAAADIAGLIEKHISSMPVFDLRDQCIHGSVCGGDCKTCDDFER